MRKPDGSPVAKNGDFVKGDATLQHQHSILLAAKNEYKSSPTTGVVLREFMNEDTDPDELQTTIQKEFEADGMTISRLRLYSLSNVDIIAGYDEE